MKILISRKKLDDELNKVSSPVSSSAVLPTLTGIHLKVDTDKIVLTGSDGDFSIKSTVAKEAGVLEIEQTGSVILPIKFILEIIKKVDSDKIVLELEDNNIVKIYNEKSNFTISCIDGDMYPEINFEKSDQVINIEKSIINDITKQVSFATSINSNKIILQGININSAGNITVTATDSFRLARKIITKPISEFNLTIPKVVLSNVNKNCKEDEIKLYILDRTILFAFDNILITSKIIEGQYPETSRLIPAEFNYQLLVNRTELIKAIDRVVLVSSNSKNIVMFDMAQNKCNIMSKTGTASSGFEEIENYNFIGDNLSIAANSKYVLDALKAFDTEEVEINFTTDVKPFIINTPNNKELLQLILPIRTY